MRLNYKVYRQLTSEPFMTQEIDGKSIEFHYMNETPFLFQYASKGRFAIWTSDGTNYKLLVEKKYYEALSDFYEVEVNTIWLHFLESVGKTSKKINIYFIVPTLILYVVMASLALFVFTEFTLQILLGMVFLVVVGNMVQGRIVNKRVREENLRAQDLIREQMGNEKFESLVHSQEEHYKEYFKFDEEPTEVNQEAIEEDVNENSEENENDGTKGN